MKNTATFPTATNPRHAFSHPLAIALKSADIGQAAINGETRYITWGRNLTTEQARWYAENTFFKPVQIENTDSNPVYELVIDDATARATIHAHQKILVLSTTAATAASEILGWPVDNQGEIELPGFQMRTFADAIAIVPRDPQGNVWIEMAAEIQSLPDNDESVEAWDDHSNGLTNIGGFWV